jgi:pyridoxal phosphate enzyme (YggS family)
MSETPDPIQLLVDNYTRVSDRVAEAAVRSAREPSAVKLVCVSKGVTVDRMRAVFAAGARVFGENRVQEAEEKINYWHLWMLRMMPEWHLIGHLQSNKARLVPRKFDCIQSIDSIRIAREVGKRVAESGLAMPVLLEVNVSGEPRKTGFGVEELRQALPELATVQGIVLRGLMAIAPADAPGDQARPFFARVRELRDSLSQEVPGAGLYDLSMGMTNDFEAAIAEGATIVRVGRAIFGERPT